METNQTPTPRSSTATLWAQIPKDIRSTLSTSRYAQTTQHKRNTHALALALIRLWTASESEFLRSVSCNAKNTFEQYSA